MKTLTMICLCACFAVPALAGQRNYQLGTILSFDTGQQPVKHAVKGEVVYQVQIQSVVYKVTNHSKKTQFSAGDQVECFVSKNHLVIQKPKGGEVKLDILAESAQPQRAAGATP